MGTHAERKFLYTMIYIITPTVGSISQRLRCEDGGASPIFFCSSFRTCAPFELRRDMSGLCWLAATAGVLNKQRKGLV